MRKNDWELKIDKIRSYCGTSEDFHRTMEALINAMKERGEYNSFHDYKEFHLYYINKKIDQQDYKSVSLEINFLLYVYCHEISIRYPIFELRLNHPEHHYGAIYFTNPNNNFSVFPLNTIYKAVFCAEDVLEPFLEAIEIYNNM